MCRIEALIRIALRFIRTTASAPLCQFDGDVVGAGQEVEVAVVEAFEFAADLDAVGVEVGDHRFDVIDGEADVVEAELVEPGDGGIAHRLGPPIVQELDLEPRRGAGEHQGHVVGLDLIETHVGGKGLAGYHHRLVLLKAEQPEKAPGRGKVADADGYMIEVPDAQGSLPPAALLNTS